VKGSMKMNLEPEIEQPCSLKLEAWSLKLEA
jgi:hypothetical protein